MISKEQRQTVASTIEHTGYRGEFMIASAPSNGNQVFVVLPPDEFAAWRISHKGLAQVEQDLTQQLELEVFIVGTSWNWPTASASAGDTSSADY